MTHLVDLEQLTASDLEHLAAIKREQERRQAEERTDRLAVVMWKPALGWYRQQRGRRDE